MTLNRELQIHLHGVARVPLSAKRVSSQIFPGDEIVERFSSWFAPIDEGAALCTDPQGGDFTGPKAWV